MTLSSISGALLTLPVKQTSTEENSILTVFIIVKECGEIFINSPNCLFGTKVNKTLAEILNLLLMYSDFVFPSVINTQIS